MLVAKQMDPQTAIGQILGALMKSGARLTWVHSLSVRLGRMIVMINNTALCSGPCDDEA